MKISFLIMISPKCKTSVCLILFARDKGYYDLFKKKKKEIDGLNFDMIKQFRPAIVANDSPE